MATAVRNSTVKNYATPQIRGTAAGWVGSKAAKKGDFVTIDSNGYIDQAAAASAAVGSTVDVGLICGAVASTVAAASADALAVKIQVPTETTVFGLKLVNNSDTEVTVTAAMQGDTFGLYRTTDGDYCADQNGTSHFLCTKVDTDNNLLYGKIVEANRLK